MHPNAELVAVSLRERGAAGQIVEPPEAAAAAGHPHTVFPTSYEELLRITGGTPAEVAD